MNKRGQIYILVALILALVLYMLITKTNIIYEHEIIDDFETLSRNYDIEASNFMNKLLASEKTPNQVKKEFDEFTCDFTKFAKNQNPDFSLIYIFEYRENIYIGNYLKQPIIIEGEDVLRGCKAGAKVGYTGQGFGGGTEQDICGEDCILMLPTKSELELSIGSSLYVIRITPERPEIIIVSREDKGEQRKVYTKEEFVGGKEKEAISGSEFCKKDNNAQKYPRFCEGICDSYKKLKEPCEYDKECCWDNILKECKPIGEC